MRRLCIHGRLFLNHRSCANLLTGPSAPRLLSITKTLEADIELNWLPPTEPNGEVHYVIYYTPEGGTEQSNNTGSNLTHYNLTGLERNRVYTNIAVQAVNSVGRSDGSAVIAQYNHTPPGELCRMSTKQQTHILDLRGDSYKTTQESFAPGRISLHCGLTQLWVAHSGPGN